MEKLLSPEEPRTGSRHPRMVILAIALWLCCETPQEEQDEKSTYCVTGPAYLHYKASVLQIHRSMRAMLYIGKKLVITW